MMINYMISFMDNSEDLSHSTLLTQANFNFTLISIKRTLLLATTPLIGSNCLEPEFSHWQLIIQQSRKPYLNRK